MGKPMGNGMPIAGVAGRSDLISHFGKKGRYFNTFGANNVSIAAAQAVFDVIHDEALMANASQVGNLLRRELGAVATQYPCIGDVRGAGLFVGVDFVRDRATRVPDGELAVAVVNGLRDRGILISASGRDGHVLKIRPPLPFSVDHASLLVEQLRRRLGRNPATLTACGRKPQRNAAHVTP